MSQVLDAPVTQSKPVRQDSARTMVADCDIHPVFRSAHDLVPFLPKRWAEHILTCGIHLLRPYTGSGLCPRSSPLLSRRDAWPETGERRAIFHDNAHAFYGVA